MPNVHPPSSSSLFVLPLLSIHFLGTDLADYPRDVYYVQQDLEKLECQASYIKAETLTIFKC